MVTFVLVAVLAAGPIEYAEIGEGPPILLVHGAGGGYDQGLDLGVPLANSGFRVIAVSRFGYLRTPLPADASAAAQAEAHAALLDALKIERAAIMGASAGAPSTMQFALRHADRCSALVLLVPAAYVPRAGNEPSVRTPAASELVALARAAQARAARAQARAARARAVSRRPAPSARRPAPSRRT